MLGKYAMLFIFAATFPAIPFFAWWDLCMPQ